jgi:hypothetical protein
MSDGEGRTRRTHYMATGTLQNAPCAACGRDTMHRHGRCLTCLDQPAQVVEAALKPRRGAVAKRMPVKL